MGDLKNVVVLKNLPSNLIDEAFVILKGNKKIHRYQVIDVKGEGNNSEDKKEDNGYIVKEAEMLVEQYTQRLNEKPIKSKKIEKKYKNSIRLNFVLLFTTILAIVFSII